MAKFKPQFVRLIWVDEQIRRGMRTERLMNARSLAEGYEVSQRTIQRDVDYMKWQLGAPLEYDARRYGYYYTEPDYKMPALNISQGDLFLVTIAQKVLEQYRGTPLYERLESVFEKLHESIPDKVSIDPSWIDERFSFFPDAAPTVDADIWSVCLNGLKESKTVTFDYQIPRHDRTYLRIVDPYHFVSYRAQWYLIGYCQYVKDIRVFALSRMTNAKATDKSFTVPDAFDFDDFAGTHFGIIFGKQEHLIRVRFDAVVAPYVKERSWHWTQVIEEQDDGSIELTMRANHLLEIMRWVLSWGGGAKVIEPPELVAMVRAEVEKMSDG
jgi:predicted DNA-binding transcriptional regulator YafY